MQDRIQWIGSLAAGRPRSWIRSSVHQTQHRRERRPVDRGEAVAGAIAVPNQRVRTARRVAVAASCVAQDRQRMRHPHSWTDCLRPGLCLGLSTDRDRAILRCFAVGRIRERTRFSRIFAALLLQLQQRSANLLQVVPTCSVWSFYHRVQLARSLGFREASPTPQECVGSRVLAQEPPRRKM